MDSSESIITTDRRVDGWLLLAVFTILLLFHYSTVVSFYNVYSEEGYDQTHAPLLLLTSLYLLYRTWTRNGRQINLRFNRLAMVLLIPLSLLWMILGLVFVEAGQQAMLILIAALAVISMLGLRAGSKYLMPILLLLTVVPVWHLIVPYLQTGSAQLSAYLLDLIGITSTREGFLLIIPNGTFEVADACSGLKFQMIGITLALIHIQMIMVPTRAALIYVLLASLLAFLSNVLRIVVVVALGYHFGMENEYVRDHGFIGWILFSVFFFLFLTLGEKWLQGRAIVSQVEEAAPCSNNGSARRITGVGMVVLAFSIGPILHGYFMNRGHSSNNEEISLLTQMPDWRRISNQLSDWEPIWTKGDQTFEGSFLNVDERVEVFATKYKRQRQGHEAVNVSHSVYKSDKWSRISKSAKVIMLPDVGEVTVQETLLTSPNKRKRLVWLWYRTNNKIVASKVQAKLNNLIGVIGGKPEITVFVVSKEIIRNEAHAAEVLERFLKAYLALIGDHT